MKTELWVPKLPVHGWSSQRHTSIPQPVLGGACSATPLEAALDSHCGCSLEDAALWEQVLVEANHHLPPPYHLPPSHHLPWARVTPN